MPRYSHLQLYQVHIADGFSSDCDEIVHRCLKLKTVDFHEFSKIWKSMNFDLLYQGRSSNAEIAELTEELIHIAKHYLVKDTSYFEESVTGLFLVYGLVTLQPFSGFACLRLTPNDVRAINRIEMVARETRRLDILYILGEVLVKWTQYHATERPRGMEMVVRKYLEGYISIDKRGMRPMGVFYRQNEELDHIRDLGSATRQYMLAKKSLFGTTGESQNFEYINENLPNELNTSLRKLINGVFEEGDEQEQDLDNDDSSSEDEKMAKSRSNAVDAIKQKAMKNAIDPMNHLVTAEERKRSKTSSRGKSDLKTPTGKIKSGTHTKTVTTGSAVRKIDENSKKKPKKKSKGNIMRDSEPEDEDDIDMDNVKLHDNSDDNVRELHQISDDDVEEVHQVDEKVKRNLKMREKEKLKHRSKPQEIQIQFDSLPLILQPGDLGQDIEIEIIDQVKPKPDEEHKPEPTETTKCSSSEDDEPLSVQAGKSVIKTYNKRSRKSDSTEETVFPVKKKEKRELKRRELKSKFKRLGMLPVANFEDRGKDK